MAKSDWLITATPPTPNGDLHVGHMSGPYLAADIFKRARMALGDSAVYVCYGDDNQSYVVTTADRLKTDPNELMDKGNADIQKTLGAYHIDMDQYTRPDDNHNKVVGDAIRLLIDKGLIIEKEVDQLFDNQSGAPLYEAFASGCCPVCLLETKGGICESCGHPNDPVDLIRKPSKDHDDSQCAIKPAKRLILPIEDYREDLIEFYKTKRGIWRPHLIQLVDELLAKPLADYPISHPNSWGIPIGLPEWDGHVINVWAEMGLGLLHLLGRHRSDTEMQQGRYVQFLGYDNSYFFAIVHPVLQFALVRAGIQNTKLPEFIFTNEFYHLENKKFSTSQGHALWGRELLEHISADEARFYLCLHGPELAESNFSLDDALTSLRLDLHKPLEAIVKNLSALESKKIILESSKLESAFKLAKDRFCFFSDPEHFSCRELAVISRNILKFLSEIDLNLESDIDIASYLWGIRFWAKRMYVFMPSFCKPLLEATSTKAKSISVNQVRDIMSNLSAENLSIAASGFSKNFEKLKIDIPVNIKESFDNLEFDKYAPDRTRERRFSQYLVTRNKDNWNIKKLPLRPFVQPKKNNTLVGGVARYFKGIRVDMQPFILKMLDVVQPDPLEGWQVNIHQYRVKAEFGKNGDPVPEGPHRDGVDYIMMVCINRNNVIGGETTILDDEMNVLYKTTLAEGDAIVIEDRKLFHDASPVEVKDSQKTGNRDIFVIALMRSSYGKYGANYEREHTGSEADLSLISDD